MKLGFQFMDDMNGWTTASVADPNISLKKLHALGVKLARKEKTDNYLGHDNLGLLKILCSREDLLPKTYRVLGKMVNTNIHKKLAANPALPDRKLTAYLNLKTNTEIVAAAISNPKLNTIEQLTPFLNSGSYYILKAVLAKPLMRNPENIIKLLKTTNPTARQYVEYAALSHHSPESYNYLWAQILKEGNSGKNLTLSYDTPFPSILRELLSHDNLPSHIGAQIAGILVKNRFSTKMFMHLVLSQPNIPFLVKLQFAQETGSPPREQAWVDAVYENAHKYLNIPFPEVTSYPVEWLELGLGTIQPEEEFYPSH